MGTSTRPGGGLTLPSLNATVIVFVAAVELADDVPPEPDPPDGVLDVAQPATTEPARTTRASNGTTGRRATAGIVRRLVWPARPRRRPADGLATRGRTAVEPWKFPP